VEEENFLCNTEGLTQEKLFSSGFSPISLFCQHKELEPENYCQQAQQPRERKANATAQLHPKGRESAPKGNTIKLSAKLRQPGLCDTPGNQAK